MTLKNILVHIDGDERSAERLDLAFYLAQRRHARLTGLFAHIDHDGKAVMSHKTGPQLLRAGHNARALFESRSAQAHIPTLWQELPFGEYNHIIHETILRARCHDLTILGQFDPALAAPPFPEELAENVILHSGRPVLMIPHSGKFLFPPTRALIAWNAEREAARALNDALPLLIDAQNVSVIVLRSEQRSFSSDKGMIRNVLDHLAAHDVHATPVSTPTPDGCNVQDLMNVVLEPPCDLLVIGASGQHDSPRLQGAVELRHVLQRMSLPTLISH